jgi:ATP-dependent DNA helicase DinG
MALGDYCQELKTELSKVEAFIEINQQTFFKTNPQYRFENGIIPRELKNLAEDITSLAKKARSELTKLYNLLMEAVKDGDLKMYQAEVALSEAGFLSQRLENLEKLWQMMAKVDSTKAAPMARWIEKTKGKRTDHLICAAPIEVGFFLEDNLWSKCEGAALCSATLMALNSFDHFRQQSGLQKNDGSQYLKIESPFDYQNNAVLRIPNMKFEPSNEQFTDELTARLEQFIAANQGNLILFSSYWQMEKLAESLRKNAKLAIEVQGEKSRQEIIKIHKQRCDEGKTSVILGTQSFSEGLDLPGHYLTNLVITKLPFSVPTSPVEEAQAEYIKAKGGNPFISLAVPEASKKLIQSCGRLLRNEKDHGVITILDRRLVTKRYGKDLLDSLPPYRRAIEN